MTRCIVGYNMYRYNSVVASPAVPAIGNSTASGSSPAWQTRASTTPARAEQQDSASKTQGWVVRQLKGILATKPRKPKFDPWTPHGGKRTHS